jgi:hypothetical protein
MSFTGVFYDTEGRILQSLCKCMIKQKLYTCRVTGSCTSQEKLFNCRPTTMHMCRPRPICLKCKLRIEQTNSNYTMANKRLVSRESSAQVAPFTPLITKVGEAMLLVIISCMGKRPLPLLPMSSHPCIN